MVTVEEILNSVSPSQKAIIEKLRMLIKDFVPNAVERVRKETIAYEINEKDFVRIKVFTDHVDADFMCGAHLVTGDLRGRGTNGLTRHIEISSEKDINENELKELIEEASQTVC